MTAKIILTPEQLKQIKELYDNSFSLAQIGKHLNLGRKMIKKAIKQLNIPYDAKIRKTINIQKTVCTDKQLQEIKKLYDLGLGAKTIAKQIKINAKIITRICAEQWGIHFERKKKLILSPQQIKQIQILYELGNGTPKISKLIGITQSIVARTVRELNIGRPHIVYISDEHKDKIKELFAQGCGTQSIATTLGFSRTIIKNIFKELGLRNPTPAEAKIILTNEQIKQIIDWYMQGYSIRKIAITLDIYSELIRKTINELGLKTKREQDRQQFWRLKKNISVCIRRQIKENNGNKDGVSCSKYLSYTIKQLRDHLESLFSHSDNLTVDGRVWMTWDNYGRFNKKTWNDNDSSTWVWNIDHIKPQSNLPYSAMTDDNFKICWSLCNLRPYSAKQNLQDGISKIRHKICKD